MPPHLPQPLPYPVELAELHPHDGGGDLGQAVVLAEQLGGLRDETVPLAGGAVVVQRDRPGPPRFGASVATHSTLACGEHLVHLEAERVDPAAGTDLNIRRPGLRGTGHSPRSTGIPCAFATSMMGGSGTASPRQCTAMMAFVARRDAAFDAGGADLQVIVHVGEHRNGPRGHHRVGAADERRGRKDHLVTRPHSEAPAGRR